MALKNKWTNLADQLIEKPMKHEIVGVGKDQYIIEVDPYNYVEKFGVFELDELNKMVGHWRYKIHETTAMLDPDTGDIKVFTKYTEKVENGN